MKQRTKIVPFVSLLIIVILLGYVMLFLFKIIKLNTPSPNEYPVWGVDVSEYQGSIDWNILKEQGVQFAFIKATEGSSYIDTYFSANVSGAKLAGIPFGAYHFFSFDSSAETQAALFIETIGYHEGMIMPVIDIELYGEKKTNAPPAEAVLDELDTFVNIIYEHYGHFPLIYTTQRSFDLYIAYNFPECPIWIRDVYFVPALSDGRAWTFWQYSDRGVLNGYDGIEKHIDMNVFRGQVDELNKYRIFYE